MKGEGVFAELIARRFKVATRRLGYLPREALELRTDLFRAPTPQGHLF